VAMRCGPRTHDLAFGQTPVALLHSPGRLRPHRGGGARFRASGGTLKRRAGRGRLRPPVPPWQSRFGGGVGGQPAEGFLRRHRRPRQPARCRGRQRPRSRMSTRVGNPGLVRSVSGPWRGKKPMEGSGVGQLATVARHNGLVGGARPCSWPLAPSRRSARVTSVIRALRGVPRSFGCRAARTSALGRGCTA